MSVALLPRLTQPRATRVSLAALTKPLDMKKPQRNGEFRWGPFDTGFFGYAALAVKHRSVRLTFERGRRR